MKVCKVLLFLHNTLCCQNVSSDEKDKIRCISPDLAPNRFGLIIIRHKCVFTGVYISTNMTHCICVRYLLSPL